MLTGVLFAISQALLLMRNLAINLTSPDFEDHVQASSFAFSFSSSLFVLFSFLVVLSIF